MSDKLAVIQSQQTISELDAIENKTKELIVEFNNLITATSTLNKGFKSGTPKEYAATLKQLQGVTKEFARIEKELAAIKANLSKAETQQAKTTAEINKARKEAAKAAYEEAKARKELANAVAAETRAQKAGQKQTDSSGGAYKRLSQEANKVKLATKNLEAEMLLLNRDFKTGIISQEGYNRELAKLQGQFNAASQRAKQLDADLKRIDANVGDRQRNVGNYRDAAVGSIKGIETHIKSMLATYVGFQALVNGTTSLVHNNYELSDSLADLQIRLNGNKEATDQLFESLRKIDTRTSLAELVNTAAIVAKKGVAAEEIEGITKALDDYFIVAGKEAGNREEGTASIVKLISIFNEDKHITAERVTEIGTALVKLQNSGVATGSKMIDIAERIGAVRGITGVTLPQVLGFAAAIEQLGQKSEVAGTAGMQILTKVLSDMPKYAKLANVSVEELRKAYSDDPFEAVVMVAEGVLKTGDFERISQDLEEVGVRGARVKGVLGDIATNADFVRKRIKDAGLAINENGYLADTAGKKQETFAATLDKTKKEFELIGSSEGFMNFIKATSALILGFVKILTAIPFGLVVTGLTVMTAAWAYYKGMMIQATIAAQWNNSQSLLGIVRNRAARMGLLGENEALRANTIQTQSNTMTRSLNVASLESQIAAERAAIIALEQKTAVSFDETIAIRQQIMAKEALILALEAEVVATEQATAATTGLNAATKVSPLGIVLGILAVVVPLMLMFSDNTEKAAIKVRTLAENQEDLNDALDKGVKNAAEEVSHLDELYKKYTDANTPMKEKKEILKEWQDYYPSYFGALKTEADLNNNLVSTYTALRDAIVSASRADAIRGKLQGRASERLSRDEQLIRETQTETELNKKIKANSKVEPVKRIRQDGGDGKSFTVELKSSDLLASSEQRLNILKKTKSNNDKADAEEDKILMDLLVKEDQKAAKLKADRAARLGKFAKVDEEKKKKEKVYGGAKLTGNQKDVMADLQAEYNNELAEQKELRYLKRTIDEETFNKNKLNISKKYREAIQNYLKGANAKERQIEAASRNKAVDEIIKINQEFYDDEKKGLEENNKIKINELERTSKAIQENQYSNDVDKLNSQIEIDNKIIEELDTYYKDQIELSANAAQTTLEWERKRDEEIGKIQDQRTKRINDIPAAVNKELEYQSNLLELNQEISVEERKRIILSDKRISVEQREYLLSILEKNVQIDKNKLQIEETNRLKNQILLRLQLSTLNGVPGVPTPEELLRLNEYEATLKRLNNENEALDKEKASTISPEMLKTKEIVSQGLNNLGLENLAAQFDDVFQKIIDGTFSAADAAKLAASSIADGLMAITNKTKENTIAALDEQLKYTQQTTEQEIGFINQRLERLNSFEELTAEQMTERNRLEDEARTYKEQQFQREKLIEAQKARAEQKAAANQALINGALGASLAIATYPFPASLLPAGLALAFGAAQAVAISAKDVVPRYFVGRQGGPAEWSITQDGGREMITNNGEIKSLGSDKGDQLTWLDKGDTVHTAKETKSILSKIGVVPKIGDNIFQKIALQSLRAPAPVVVNQNVDNSGKIADLVGKEFDKAFRKYTHDTSYKADGKIFVQRGANFKEVIGYYDMESGREISIEQYNKQNNDSN